MIYTPDKVADYLARDDIDAQGVAVNERDWVILLDAPERHGDVTKVKGTACGDDRKTLLEWACDDHRLACYLGGRRPGAEIHRDDIVLLHRLDIEAVPIHQAAYIVLRNGKEVSGHAVKAQADRAAQQLSGRLDGDDIDVVEA